jgi:hypothetical protein
MLLQIHCSILSNQLAILKTVAQVLVSMSLPVGTKDALTKRNSKENESMIDGPCEIIHTLQSASSFFIIGVVTLYPHSSTIQLIEHGYVIVVYLSKSAKDF